MGNSLFSPGASSPFAELHRQDLSALSPDQYTAVHAINHLHCKDIRISRLPSARIGRVAAWRWPAKSVLSATPECLYAHCNGLFGLNRNQLHSESGEW